MADIIRLLPDHIANQIAAGEVIQRPASVVKELLENAIDAGATEITLIIKDAGKTLIQIIDNGSGMSATDVRMAFERHATSKIKEANDLFHITTKGFRGEALASIAAIAHVEVLTRQASEEVGHRLVINGSKVEKQEIIQAAVGTQFSVKNLFFNVPARRKFLKSEPVELKHIIDEFQRVSLAHPQLYFILMSNGIETYRLPPGSLKQRIVGIMGKGMDAKLLPVNEHTDVVNIEGFVGKIEGAKKKSGDQYLFVNNRFVKNHYLTHAVKAGYDVLLQKEQYPVFFLYITIDPSQIDINVHPTKTEIKFEEERLIYNYIKVSVKHALGKYIVSPTLDFETDTNFIAGYSSSKSTTTDKRSDNLPDWSRERYESDADRLNKENVKAWDKIYQNITPREQQSPHQTEITFESDAATENVPRQDREPYQLHSRYIVSHIKSGYILIDQHLAHQRILFEKNLKSLEGTALPVQRELFPIQIELDPATAAAMLEIMPSLNQMGFEIGEFGQNSFVVHGTPSGMHHSQNAETVIKAVLQQYVDNIDIEKNVQKRTAMSLSRVAALQRGKSLTIEEMKHIIDELFACETPFSSPFGKKTFMTVYLNDLTKYFEG